MDIKNWRCCAAQAVWLVLIILFSGCVTPFNHEASVTRNDAFIDYWPGPKGSNDLRLAVKDLIDLKGVVTTAGSEYFEKHGQPAARDAACMAIARERGVLIVGKTNLDEFAVGVTGMNEYFGIPRNRLSRRRDLIPGGSSSGSAVAVQSGMADVAFGTDTAGSIRVPAACCGIVGLRTTYGLISLRGVYPVEPAYLDSVGPMGKDIAHVVEGMDLLQRGFRDRYQSTAASGRQIRIGRLYVSGTDPKIDQAIDAALRAGALRQVFARVDLIALPTLKRLPPRVPVVGGTPVFEALTLALENTAAVNFAGNPAVAMPVPVDDNDIPVTSLQLIGPRLSEARVLSAGHSVELAVRPAVERAMAAKAVHGRDDARLKWRVKIRAAVRGARS
jgi:Asp-tRNA(Asn)/Glu-tRNA(Gln) amidotransferase A subunit family amidase